MESAVLFAVLLLALFILFSIFIWVRKKRIKPKPLSSLPPREVALEALKALKRKDLLTKGKVEEHYLEMADIIRRYLDGEYGWKTSQMTTEERLSRLERTERSSQGQKDLLKEFLKECDLVKFAQSLPTPQENDSSFGMAQEIVLQTKEVD
jgi:hypothetical protein